MFETTEAEELLTAMTINQDHKYGRTSLIITQKIDDFMDVREVKPHQFAYKEWVSKLKKGEKRPRGSFFRYYKARSHVFDEYYLA